MSWALLTPICLPIMCFFEQMIILKNGILWARSDKLLEKVYDRDDEQKKNLTTPEVQLSFYKLCNVRKADNYLN